MKPSEIVELIRESNPGLLGEMSDDRAGKIVRAVLMHLGKHIDSVAEGAVKVPGLGNFRIKQVEQEKAGEKHTLKRIVFSTIKPKAQ